MPQTRGAAGDVDLSFNPGSSINGSVWAIVLQNDGRILIGGNFTTVGGAMRGGIARLNADGSLDETFLHGMAGVVNETVLEASVGNIVVQTDGKILIDGYFTSVNGVARTNIARLNPDGSLDASFQFSVNATDWVGPLRLQPDGKILLAGAWGSVGGANLARLNPDGSVDGSFVAQVVNAWQHVDVLALQSDGEMIVSGPLASGISVIARLKADGSNDSSFACTIAPPYDASLGSVSFQPDGKILIAGFFTSVNGLAHTNIARLNTDGSEDVSFLSGPTGIELGFVTRTALQGDGKVLIGGWDVCGVGCHLARLESDGTLDGSFDCGLDAQVDCLTQQNDGKILIAGPFTLVNGMQRNRLTRLNLDGSLDASFPSGQTGLNGEVRTIVLQGTTNILVGGGFSSVNGAPPGGIARLKSDGSLDSSLSGTTFEHAPAQWNPFVYSLAVQNDGKVVVGGQFTSVNGVARTNIARLNGDGSLDASFVTGAVMPDASPGSIVQSVALQPDGKIVFSGEFISVNGVARTNIARLNSDGSLDYPFHADLGPFAASGGPLLVQNDGKILIAGSFWTVNGVARTNLARLNPDGSLDDSFLHDLAGVPGYIACVALQQDGRILIGGQFSSVNGVSRHNIARLNSDGSLDASFLNGLGTDYDVNSVALQPDGKALIGGMFGLVNGVSRNRIARLNPDGSLDLSFLNGLAGPNNDLSAVALQPDGKILVGVFFTVFNQTPRGYVARLIGDVAPTNRPPVAGTPFIKVIGNEVSEIPARRFLIWCSDPDNDPLSLTGVTSPSAMGALVTLETNQVSYAPSPGFLGDDTFGYTITDGNGGFASGTALLLVEPRSSAAATMLPPITSPGALQLNFTGFADLGYTVERAESLQGPWTAIGNVITDDNGSASFTDPNPPAANAFYRAVHY
jgi:uncharacterized delta-60 repeat protein